MSSTWFFSLAALLNVASILMLVYSTRERRRIEDARRAARANEIRLDARRRT